MKRDTKIGLVVAAGFLGLVGFLVYKKLHQYDDLVASLAPAPCDQDIAPLNTGPSGAGSTDANLSAPPHNPPPMIATGGSDTHAPSGGLPAPETPPSNVPPPLTMPRDAAAELTQASAQTSTVPMNAPPAMPPPLPMADASSALPSPMLPSPPSKSTELTPPSLPTGNEPEKSKEPAKEDKPTKEEKPEPSDKKEPSLPVPTRSEAGDAPPLPPPSVTKEVHAPAMNPPTSDSAPKAPSAPPKPDDSPLHVPSLGGGSLAPPAVPESGGAALPPSMQPKVQPKVEPQPEKKPEGATLPPLDLGSPTTPLPRQETPSWNPSTSPSMPSTNPRTELPSLTPEPGKNQQIVKIKEQPDLPKSDVIMPSPIRTGAGEGDFPSTAAGQGQVEVYDVTIVTVKEGETMAALAKRLYGHEKYAPALEEYLRIQDPKQLHLQTNQSLRVPPIALLHKRFRRFIDGGDGVETASGTLASVPRGTSSTTQPLVKPSGAAPSGEPATGSARDPRYRVREQDTIWNIAKRTLGNSERWAEIYNLNRDLLGGSTQLQVGMVLRLPADAKVDIHP